MKIKRSISKNIIYSFKKKLPLCACGCGKEVTNEKNKFVKGHNHKPWKGKKLSKQQKLKISKSRTGKKHSEESKLTMVSKGFLRKKHTEESKIKIANFNIGKKHSCETRTKQSKNNPCCNKGKKLTQETRLKMSISRKKYIEENGINCVKEGKNEKFILDQIKNNIGIELFRNNQEISRRIKGKSTDGYNSKYNLCIEVLEPAHFKTNNELSDNDQKRELIIVCNLSCMIYYISEQEFLKNSEKEIQRLKDFLVLLDQGRN